MRKSLVTKNKAGQYLLYAIGEIILVVIGILFALQINNWNETKRNRINEIKTLSQLNIDLKSNLNEISSIKEEIIDYNLAGKKILNHLDSDAQITDSLTLWVDYFGGRNIFNNANTTYNTIQNNTENNITNDSLRLKITLMYELDFENIHKREKILGEDYFRVYSAELNKNFKAGPTLNKEIINTEFAVNTPINLELLKTNEHYKNVLIGVYNFRLVRISWLTKTITDLNVLIADVDAEIERLKQI